MPSEALVKMMGTSQPLPQNLYTIASVYPTSLRSPDSCISKNRVRLEDTRSEKRQRRKISCIPLPVNNPLPFLQRCVSSFRGDHIPGQF